MKKECSAKDKSFGLILRVTKKQIKIDLLLTVTILISFQSRPHIT